MRRILIASQIILYVLETSLQLNVAANHGLVADDIWHRHVCLILIGVILIMSSAIFTVVSIIWIYRTMDFSGKKIGNAICILMHIIQLGAVWRFFKILITNDSQDIREFLLLRVVQASLQTLPFLVVQGYAMLASDTLVPVHLASVIISLMSVNLAYTSYQGQGDAMEYRQARTTWKFKVMTWVLLLLAKPLLLAARVVSFVMFSDACTFWILLLLGIHCAAYSVIVYLMRRIFHCSNITANLANTFQSLVHVFDHLSPSHGVPKSELISFYLLVSVENVAMGVAWYLTERALHVKAMLFAGALVCQLFGVLLLCLYHGCMSSGIATSKVKHPEINEEDVCHTVTTEPAGPPNTHLAASEAAESLNSSDQINSSQHSDLTSGDLDLTNSSSDRTGHNETDTLNALKSINKGKARSHSFTCAMALNGHMDSGKAAGDQEHEVGEAEDSGKSSERGTWESESGIDVAQCEAMVDEQWLAGQGKKNICQADEEGSGYFSGGDGCDIATIPSSLTGGGASCSSISFPSATGVQRNGHYDSGYFSKGDHASSSSSVSSPKANPVKLSVVDLQQYMPGPVKTYSFSNRYPKLLDTTAAAISGNNNNYESSLTSCCSCSRQSSTLSSAVVSDSDEVNSYHIGRDTPVQWKTLPPSRSREWQKMLHEKTAPKHVKPENIVHVGSFRVEERKKTCPEKLPQIHKQNNKTVKSKQSAAGAYDSKKNSQEWFQTWHTPYESSLCSSTDLCSQSMYDLRDAHFSDSSSFCTTCDEQEYLQEYEDSETDFTMTWPPSNVISRRNLSRLPQERIPRDDHVTHWLKQVQSYGGHEGQGQSDSCESEVTMKDTRVQGRREVNRPLCNHAKDCDKQNTTCKTSKPHRSIMKHNGLFHSRTLSAKTVLLSLCASQNSKPQKLYPYNLSGAVVKADNSEPIVGKETEV